MAFAPPRPQSIFGRSAPPAPQIDWRLGAQVGQNIGGGIQSAMESLSKGFVKFQEAKAKKNAQDEVYTYARGMGLDEADAKMASKQPELWGVMEKIDLMKKSGEREKFRDRSEALRHNTAYVRMLQENKRKDEAAARDAAATREKIKFDVDNDAEALRRAPEVLSFVGEDMQLDEASIEKWPPELQAAFYRQSPEALEQAEKKTTAKSEALKELEKGTSHGELSDVQLEGLMDLRKAGVNITELTGDTKTQIVVGGDPDNEDHTDFGTQFAKLPEGVMLVVDKLGAVKNTIKTSSESMSRYKEFVGALKAAKVAAGETVPDGWQPNAQIVQKYFLADKGHVDFRDLAMLISQLEGTVNAEQALDMMRAAGGGTLGVGGDTPAPTGTPAPIPPVDIPFPPLP